MVRQRQRLVLVFGEDDNDRSALIELVRAIRPEANLKFGKRAKPPVLVRKSERPSTRTNALQAMIKLIRAAQVADDVVAVIAHRDCDEIEPAHVQATDEIERALTTYGIRNAVAATPAYEMEAWWFLFPEALSATRGCWITQPAPRGNVGYINDAKGTLTRLLRPTAGPRRNRCPDYTESDSIKIAMHIKQMRLIRRVTPEMSASLSLFVKKIDKLNLGI